MAHSRKPQASTAAHTLNFYFGWQAAKLRHWRQIGLMDFTPEDMEAVQVCLEGIDRNVPVTVEPAAAVLLMPNTVRTVGDVLALPEWPAEQLRLVLERWQPDIEVRLERIR